MNKLCTLLAAAAALAAAPLTAPAQDSEAAQPETWSMTWSDSAFEQIADAMIGTWRTTEPVGATADGGEPVEIVMSIAPAKLTELPDALYVETARADALAQPYRSAFLQLYRRQGVIRLRTLEVRGPGNPVLRMLVGLWTTPEFIPDVPRDDLIATLDLALTEFGGGWVGQTPYPYPTAVGGAVEMTSRMIIANDTIETADRGFGADGAVLWGPGEDQTYTFERAEPHFAVRHHDSGVTIITLHEAEGEASQASDRVVMQYTGWLTDGRMFDTSRVGRNARPLSYTVPPAGYIPGWVMGTEGMGLHDWRKFIVPSELGYGSQSAARGAIPPNSTLVFEAECVSLEPGALRGAGGED